VKLWGPQSIFSLFWMKIWKNGFWKNNLIPFHFSIFEERNKKEFNTCRKSLWLGPNLIRIFFKSSYFGWQWKWDSGFYLYPCICDSVFLKLYLQLCRILQPYKVLQKTSYRSCLSSYVLLRNSFQESLYPLPIYRC
jgi:hypothetical protein